MRRATAVLFVVLGCAAPTEPAPPADLSGTWTSGVLTLTIAHGDTDIGGTATYRHPGGGTCFPPVSGRYEAPDVSAGFGSVVNCAGSFNGTASGDRITGTLDFRYSPSPGVTAVTYSARITLVRQP